MSAWASSYAFLALAFLLAGSSVAPGKILSGLPPFAACAGSAAIGLVALLPFALRECRSERGAITRAAATATLRRALPLLAAQAFFGLALFRALLLAALARTSAAEVGIATSATPAITALLASVFLKERIGARKIGGIALVVAGVALLEASGGAAAGGASAAGASAAGASAATRGAERLVGLALALGAAASESVFNVMSKRLPSTLGPRTTSAAVTAIALVMLVILSAVAGERVVVAEIGPARLAAFAYYGVFASALAYLCWFRGIKKVPASTAGIFSGFMPLSGFGLSMLLFGERPGALGTIGAGLALAGMTLCAAGEGLRLRFSRPSPASGRRPRPRIETAAEGSADPPPS